MSRAAPSRIASRRIEGNQGKLWAMQLKSNILLLTGKFLIPIYRYRDLTVFVSLMMR